MKKLIGILILLLAVFAAPGYAGIVDGLTNLWTFDETSGDTAFATVGSADWTGILGGSWGAGMWGNAAVGTNDFRGFAPDGIAELVDAETFTISVWMFADRATDKWSCIMSAAESDKYFLLALDTIDDVPDGYMDYDFRVCGPTIKSQGGDNIAKLKDKQWNHIVITWDYTLGLSDALNLWINGYKVTKGTPDTVTGSYGTFTRPLAWDYKLGQDRDSSGRRFAGKFDEIAIWTRILADNEIRTLYADGAGNTFVPAETVVQEGTPGTFNVVLSQEPANYPATVSIECDVPNAIVSGTPEYTFDLSAETIDITAENWDDDHIVKITPVDDSIRKTDQNFTLSTMLSVTPHPDPNIVNTAFAAPMLVNLRITDNDTPQIVLTGADDVVVSEAAGTDSFTVSLSAPLTGAETATVDLSADEAFLLLSTSQAVFTSASQEPVEVTVTAVDNSDADNAEVPYSFYIKTITLVTSSSIPEMSDAPNVDVKILEDDCGAMGIEPLDTDGNCIIDIIDLQALMSQWLDCNYPNMDAGECF